MYRLFYNHEVLNDVLLILIKPDKKVTKTIKKGEVVALFSDDELVGYNIFEISKTIKIKAHGAIFDVAPMLLEAINNILIRNDFSPLEPLTSSGYEVMKIVSLEEHPLYEKEQIVTLIGKDNKQYQTVSPLINLSVVEMVIVATSPSILFDGTYFEKYVSKNIPIDVLIMSSKELRLGEEEKEAFIINEGYDIGDDFFLTKQK